MNAIKKFSIFTLAVLILLSCKDESGLNTTSNGFDYRTIREYTVQIRTQNVANQNLKNVYIELYTASPLNEAGLFTKESARFLIFKGMTNERGILSCKIAPATTVDSLYILTRQIGLPTMSTVALRSSTIEYTIGGSSAPAQVPAAMTALKAKPTIPKVKKTSDDKYYILGSWHNTGVPNYLTDDDVVEQSLLNDINASLPEKQPLTVSHPEYLSGTEDGKIKLIEDAEVWVTFVHEGAGYLNSLLYYTYPTGNPPATTGQITDPTIIFPNVSFKGSGGNLQTGNKVQLFYLDPKTGEYTNVFPAGITISWMLKSNSWNKNKVGDGYYTVYSDLKLNPESDQDLKKHVVILRDDVRKLLILGFEDVRRDENSDNDFNDAIFYSTVTPYTAVDRSDLPEIDTDDSGSGSGPDPDPETDPDKDNDGVNDVLDEYPDDPEKAFNNYYPSKEGTGTLAFEDLYPNRGDYDFNDMVVDYNFNQITNAANEVVELDMKLTLRAIGASYFNGFGIQLNTLPSSIRSVTGQRISDNILTLSENGTEANQAKAVIMAFDNAFSILSHPGQGSMGVNTTPGAIYVEPVEFTLNVKLTNPVAVTDFGTPPYNPFIFIDKDRSREVHLPTYPPTDLADRSLFGTGDDDSNPETGKYYMSSKYHPWAINLPVQFDYPAEKEDITATYLHFNEWANSKGEKFDDWYKDQEGYRSVKKIYVKPVTEK